MASTSGTQKRKRGERGTSACKTNIKDYHIEFDANHKPGGANMVNFNSWYGVTVRARLPIHPEPSKLDESYYTDLWNKTKVTWNIENEHEGVKGYLLRRAKKIQTNFRSVLTLEYAKNNLSPCGKYTYIDDNMWKTFVARTATNEFKEKSAKAKASNSKNKFTSRLGRGGWKAAERDINKRWDSLVAKYPSLNGMSDERSKRFVVSKAKKNIETKEYELPQDVLQNADILHAEEKRMIADAEHGGRSRTVSDIIGHTQVHGGLIKNVTHDRPSIPPVDTNLVAHGPGTGLEGRHIHRRPITKMTKCHIQVDMSSTYVTIATGVAWPTTDRLIHWRPVDEGCVKVSIDAILPQFAKVPVIPQAVTDEVRLVENMEHTIVQWARDMIVLVNTEAPSQPANTSEMDAGLASLQPTYDDFTTIDVYRPAPPEENICPSVVAPEAVGFIDAMFELH